MVILSFPLVPDTVPVTLSVNTTARVITVPPLSDLLAATHTTLPVAIELKFTVEPFLFTMVRLSSDAISSLTLLFSPLWSILSTTSYVAAALLDT